MSHKFLIALSAAALVTFLTPQAAFAGPDRDHDDRGKVSDTRSGRDQDRDRDRDRGVRDGDRDFDDHFSDDDDCRHHGHHGHGHHHGHHGCVSPS